MEWFVNEITESLRTCQCCM